MFTRVKALLADIFNMAGRDRARNSLLMLNDHLLQDLGISRDLLLKGNTAWPWRVDSVVEAPSAVKEQRIINVYSMASEKEAEILRAINELKTYSDRQLADIGIARNDIEFVVRNGRPKLDEDPRNVNLHKDQQIAA